MIPAVQGSHVQVSVRVTSSGHAILHEIKTVGRPDDPIIMLYLNDDRLYLRQYADFGNRPRLLAKPSADEKRIEFDFMDVSGTKEYGYMEQAVFTMSMRTITPRIGPSSRREIILCACTWN